MKWLLVDSVLTRIAVGASNYSLRVGPDHASPLTTPLSIHETDHDLLIDTGAAEFRMGRKEFFPLQSVKIGAGENAVLGGMETTLIDKSGVSRSALVENVDFESRGPVRTTVRFTGRFARLNGLRFRARVCFFAGTGLVRIRFTLHNTRRATHRGGLWDLGDAGSILFREMGLNLLPPDSQKWKSRLKDQPDASPEYAQDGNLHIYQDSSGGQNWQSRNHVNGEGRVPCRFCGYEVTSTRGQWKGLRATPVLSAATSAGCVAVAIPEFWQQFPKGLSCDASRLAIGLFPGQWDDLFELQGGEQKTHTIWLNFGTGAEQLIHSLDWVHAPLNALPDPKWTAETGVIPHLTTATEDDKRYRRYLQDFVSGPRNVFVRREEIDEFGWRNYGDMYADHEALHYRGPHTPISHYNNQFDPIQGAILQWLRSANPIWTELFDPLARHVTDIDVYHTNEDRAVYNGGLFWFTDHYLDAATSTHRTYSASNRPANGAPYGGGPASEHNFTTGLLLYYCLTGDTEVRDTVLQLADCVLNKEEGRNNILGVLDPNATGNATGTTEADYRGPSRAAGNSVNALIDGWFLTRDRRYLSLAEELIRRVCHPEEDVARLQLDDSEKRWSYTVFLAALARYLDMKVELHELDAQYEYAQGALLRYASWMLEHERPYFDRRGELEFPTETWPAQEFRKANVLRLAAGHAEPEQARRLRARADELAERAWSDLLSFPFPWTARAAAILMTEGVCDSFFRTGGAITYPRLSRPARFAPAPTFCSQRSRVRARLRSVAGAATLLGRLLNPRSWKGVRLSR